MLDVIMKRSVNPVFIVFAAALLAAAGCAMKTKPVSAPKINFTVKSTTAANEGKPFYIVIRSCNSKEFVTGGYDSVAGALFGDPPDKSIIAYHEVIPGYTLELTAEKPDTNSIGVYCLFSDPGDEWKQLLPRPLEPRYKIDLGRNTIVSVERMIHRRKGVLQKIFSRD